MKIKIHKKDLKNVLVLASKVSTVTHNLLTETILISSNKENNVINFIFYNSSIRVEYSCKENIEVIENGNILVKTKLFDSIVSKLKDQIIEIEEIDTNVMTIKQEKMICNLNTIDDEIYSEISFDKNPDIYFSINLKTLNENISKCSHCLLTKQDFNVDMNPVLSGVNLFTDSQNCKISIQTSDTAKLAKTTIDGKSSRDLNIIIPQHVTSFIDSLEEKADTTTFYISSKNDSMYFEINNCIKIVATLIDGKFPDTSRVVEVPDVKKVYEINAKDFYDAIERVVIMTDNSTTFPMELKFNNNEIVLRAKSYELGDVTESVDLLLNNNDEDANNIKVNAKYLSTIIKTFGNSNILINVIDGQSIPRLVFEYSENNPFIQVLAPLR